MYIIYSKSIQEASEVCLGKALSQSQRLLTRLIINLMIQVHDNYDIQIITNVEVTPSVPNQK